MVKLNSSSLSLASHFKKYQARHVEDIYVVPDINNKKKYINIKISLEHNYKLGFYHKPLNEPWQKITLENLEKIISDKYSLNFNSENFVYQFKPTEDFVKTGAPFYFCLCKFIDNPWVINRRLSLSRPLKKTLKELVEAYPKEEFYHNMRGFLKNTRKFDKRNGFLY